MTVPVSSIPTLWIPKNLFIDMINTQLKNLKLQLLHLQKVFWNNETKDFVSTTTRNCTKCAAKVLMIYERDHKMIHLPSLYPFILHSI